MPNSEPQPARLRTRLASSLWLWLLAALVLANLLRHWDASLLDRHEFRQTQTALSAHYLREEGWRLDYPLPVFGPPWSAPMEFPLYQGVVAEVSKRTGCSIEAAGRGVSVAAFFAALPALAGLLAAAGFPPRSCRLALAAVLLAPVYLFYARTVLIETSALALALWFLLAQVRAVATGRRRWIAAALAFGVLAALEKITTFLPLLVPAAVWSAVLLWRRWRSGADGRGRLACRFVLAAFPALVALAAGWWWVRFSDAVKAANPLAVHLQSASLSTWNFGTLAQRFDPAAWRTFWLQVTYTTCSRWVLVVAAVCAVFAPRRHRLGMLACVATFAIGPLLFFNLYLVHDYYFCANSVFLAAAVGLAVAGLWEQPRVPRWAAVAVALLVGGLQVRGFDLGLGMYLAHEPAAPPPLAAAIRAVVPRKSAVLVLNKGWNPELAFYMQRRALMLPDGFHNDLAALASVVGRLPAGTLGAVVVRGNDPVPVELYAYVVDELGFSPEAFATDGTNTLFLRPAQQPTARALLHGLAGVAPGGPALPSFPAAAEFKTHVAPLPGDNSLCRPAPLSGRSLYGFALARNGELPCIVAHAPSQLTVAPPPGARALELRFGLADECITAAPPSDSVVVSVYTRGPGGRRLLFARRLDPARRVADRGPQSAHLDLPADLAGPLVLDASVGVFGDLANDWFYWYGIALH